MSQERSRQTRRKLVEAASKLWVTRGFDETPVSDVCEAAGVSKGTFYFYFPRKEDLLLELSVVGTQRTWSEWQEWSQTDEPTKIVLHRVVRAVSQRMGRLPKPLLERAIRELFATPGQWAVVRGERKDLVDLFRAAFERGQSRGELRYGESTFELASIQAMLFLQGMFIWSLGDERTPEDILWPRVELVLRSQEVPRG